MYRNASTNENIIPSHIRNSKKTILQCAVLTVITCVSTKFYTIVHLFICQILHRYTVTEQWKEGRKEMFYLTTHSTHFYLRLYGIRHMVKHHSDSEKGNLLLPHRLLFPISSKGSFYMHHPTDRIAHSTAFVTPVVEHCLEREITQWVHPMKDRSDDPSHHERTLLPQSYTKQWKH